MPSLTLIDPGSPTHDPQTDYALSIASSWVAIHAQLAALGPFDLIEDRASGSARDRLRRLLFHLRPGGRYVIHRARTARGGVEGLLDELSSLANAEVPRTYQDRRANGLKALHALAATLELVHRDDSSITVTHTGQVTPVLPPGELMSYRNARIEHALVPVPAVVATRSAAGAGGRGSVRASDDAFLEGRPPTWTAPALRLTEWENAICRPRGYASAHGVVLPASFQSNAHGYFPHTVAASWAPGFHGAQRVQPTTRLDGTYYYQDNTHRGHFGHVVTEQLTSTWAHAEAVARYPDLKVLASRGGGAGLQPFELTLLAAAGVSPESIVLIDGPVEVERLLTPTAAYRRPDYVHPEALRVFDEVGRTLARESTLAERPEAVFLTRAGANRECVNAREVEQHFAELGYAIISPETLDISEQIALVRDCERLAGFAGRNLFHLAFATHPLDVTAITHAGYPAHNEYLLSRAIGHNLRFLVGSAVVDGSESFDPEAFHSSYSVDLEAVRDFPA